MRGFNIGVTAILAILFAAMSAMAAGNGVFVVDATYSLHPDGACQELTGGTFGSLAKKNVCWDEATKTVKLAAAQNEEIAVQIVIPMTGKGFSGKMSELKGPGTITADRATFSALVWANTRDGKIVPDLVIPLDGSINGLRSFDVPVAFKGKVQTDEVMGFTGLPEAGNKVGSMLLEVWVPKTAPAGVYKGTITVLEGEAAADTLNVELTVLGFVLPDMPTFAFDLLDYGMPADALGLKTYLNTGAIGSPAQMIADDVKKANYQTYKLAADNRCFINVLPYSSQRGSPRYGAPVEGKGTAAKVMSWKEYDDFFAPILDGKCNKFGEPPAHMQLAFNVNYPHLCEGEPEKQFNWLPYTKTMPEKQGMQPAFKEFEDTNKTIAQEYIRQLCREGVDQNPFRTLSQPEGRRGAGRAQRHAQQARVETRRAGRQGRLPSTGLPVQCQSLVLRRGGREEFEVCDPARHRALPLQQDADSRWQEGGLLQGKGIRHGQRGQVPQGHDRPLGHWDGARRRRAAAAQGLRGARSQDDGVRHGRGT